MGVPTIADPAAVFIDFQGYFCSAAFGHVDGEGEAEGAAAIAATNAFLERYRETGRTPMFVRTHHDEASNSPVWARKYEARGEVAPCRPGSDEAAFAEDLDVRDSDLILTKHRYDAFYATSLETYLSANAVGELLIGGVATHICVESAMRSAFDRDYDATLLADCTASNDPEDKATALERIDGSFGRVTESDSIALESRSSTQVSDSKAP